MTRFVRTRKALDALGIFVDAAMTRRSGLVMYRAGVVTLILLVFMAVKGPEGGFSEAEQAVVALIAMVFVVAGALAGGLAYGGDD